MPDSVRLTFRSNDNFNLGPSDTHQPRERMHRDGFFYQRCIRNGWRVVSWICELRALTLVEREYREATNQENGRT